MRYVINGRTPIKPGDWIDGCYVERVEPYAGPGTRHFNVVLALAKPDGTRERRVHNDPALPCNGPHR